MTANPPTIDAWIDAHADRLYRAAALLSSEGEAADLCQEVFLIAARKQADFEGRSQPYTWLYGILRNLVRDRRKKAATRLRLVPDAPVAGPSVDGLLSAAQDRVRVRQAVGQLPERQREAVVLFYLEELPVAAVAKRLGLPAGTVKSRLFEARKTLKRALK